MSDIDSIIQHYFKKGHDFGFSGVDELPFEETIKAKEETLETLRARLKASEELIMPFLVNLMKAETDYIRWPVDSRQKQIKEAIDKLLKITRA